MDFDATLIREGFDLANAARKTGELEHLGLRGTGREQSLSAKLLNGLLPASVGIGKGTIVGTNGVQSPETDIILYDIMRSPAFLEKVVFPSLGVYGTISVKSGLSKDELKDAFNNVAAFKAIRLDDPSVVSRGMTPSIYSMQDGFPFGTIFAYGLKGNSLDSLRDNLKEFEQGVDPMRWPNAVCVLGEGLIIHESGTWGRVWNSLQLAGGKPVAMKYGLSAFTEYYRVLIDLINNITIKRFDVNLYRALTVQADGDSWSGDVRWFNEEQKTILSVKPDFIRTIVGAAKRDDLSAIEERLGIPEDRRLSVKGFQSPIEVYDPEDRLPVEAEAGSAQRTIINKCRILVRNRESVYAVPRSYFSSDFLEERPL